jgi:hypothetical protein
MMLKMFSVVLLLRWRLASVSPMSSTYVCASLIVLLKSPPIRQNKVVSEDSHQIT